jgi:pyrroloquinoline quinone (PQQ) biosynthesis protein C
VDAKGTSMAERSPIEAALRKLVRNHPLIVHPVLTGERDEHADRRAALLWVRQQYFMSISLSQCFAAIYARVPLTAWRERFPLLDLLLEEAWGHSTCSHGQAFVAFFRSIGGDQQELETVAPMPETLRAVETRLAIAQGSHGYGLSASALALAFGNEYANIFLFSRLRKAVCRLFPAADLAYFDEHVRDERHHSASLVRVAGLGSDAADRASADRATIELLDARRAFFEAITSAAAAGREPCGGLLPTAIC